MSSFSNRSFDNRLKKLIKVRVLFSKLSTESVTTIVAKTPRIIVVKFPSQQPIMNSLDLWFIKEHATMNIIQYVDNRLTSLLCVIISCIYASMTSLFYNLNPDKLFKETKASICNIK